MAILEEVVKKLETLDDDGLFTILENIVEEKYGYFAMLEPALNELELEYYNDDIFYYARKEGKFETIKYILQYLFDNDEDEFNELAEELLK